MTRWLQILLSSTLVVGAGACSGAHEPSHEQAAPSVATPALAFPQLDVPALLPLTVDEISQRLGPPRPLPPAFEDPTRLPSIRTDERLDSTRFFQSRGLSIVVAYDDRSRMVSDVLLLGSDEDELMARGGLQLNAPNYLLLPVFQRRRPTQLQGLRVLALELNQ